jgi:hypothetical protein
MSVRLEVEQLSERCAPSAGLILIGGVLVCTPARTAEVVVIGSTPDPTGQTDGTVNAVLLADGRSYRASWSADLVQSVFCVFGPRGGLFLDEAGLPATVGTLLPG